MKNDWLAERARLSGSRIAIIEAEKGHRWTFQQMNQRAINLAYYLQSQGIEPGDRVALFSSNDIAHFDLLFACTKIGAIFIPLNWRLRDTEVEQIVKDSAPKIILYSRIHKTRLTLVDEHLLDLDIDSEAYNALVNPEVKHEIREKVFPAEDIAVLIYTSGTTGQPKGAMISHKAIITNALTSIPSWHLSDKDRGMTTTPMFHTAGLFCFTIPILVAGGQIIIQRFFYTDETIEIIRDFKPTKAFFVPTMCYMLADSDLFVKENFKSLEMVISGGAPLSEKVYRLFADLDLPLVNSYGLTEIGPNNFSIHPALQKSKPTSVGKPILFNTVRLVDENGQDVADGEIGELIISNEARFSGYWNKPEETAKTLKDGYVYTGDLARIDADGDYFIVGRSKEMIITGGENVYPSEVETVLNQFPQVMDSAVFGIPAEQWGESVVAAIILKEDSGDILEELKEFAREHLAGYKTPKRYYILAEFPKSPVGKIDKKALLAMAKEEEERHASREKVQQIIM
ncbi:class I adenylate-forming enzyme family protein [Streptococcus parauberis]|uniref:Putative long-chain-fatty-acid--CoA ligase n=1 Tax=Streptococcus parauberis NCFD 2020 TaxID=873447 RepID=F1Z1M8_9STRE|nr:AMP-binding protein [Streptococcus parauberis]EGE53278.1 putative long-chain-fatty-acid--CoA ligase [Streptococcus parauberis NCFD 2020]